MEKIDMIQEIKDNAGFNDFDPLIVKDKLAKYSNLWSKIIWLNDTLWIVPEKDKESLAELLARSMNGDEVNWYDVEELIAKTRADPNARYSAYYEKIAAALENLQVKGKILRVWWD